MLSGRWTCRRCYAANNPSDESCTSCGWPRVPGSAPPPGDASAGAPGEQVVPHPEGHAGPEPPRPWWRSLLRFAWILIPIGIIGIGLITQARRDDGGQIVGGGTLDVAELGVGDCYNSDAEDEIAEVDARPCTEPHEYEVIAIVTYPSGGASEYPGDDAVIEYVGPECARQFEEYVGIPYDDSVYYLTFLLPSIEGWESGDHETICVGYHPNDATLDESMRGAER